MLNAAPWLLAFVIAVVAGVLDWRFRRIPNWLTLLGLLLGVVANTVSSSWQGLRASLLGALLGLVLLLPLVLLKSLGAGDWKLVGALGAAFGPASLLDALGAAILIAGVMACILIVYKRRVRQSLRNIFHLLRALFALHAPAAEVTLDNPGALKVPFGVAVAMAAVVVSGQHLWAAF